MDFINSIIDEKRKDYKCYDLLKQLLTENEDFKTIIQEGIKEGKIKGFNQKLKYLEEDLWTEISNTSVYNRREKKDYSFEDIFLAGYNIGTCTTTSTHLSYIFNDCEIYGGTVPILKGTNNSPDGRHTWIKYENDFIDTTLMLIISKDYLEKLGYIIENHYNPNTDTQGIQRTTYEENKKRARNAINQKRKQQEESKKR